MTSWMAEEPAAERIDRGYGRDGRLLWSEEPRGTVRYELVEFGYDALGRRTWKRYRGVTTLRIWDGDVIVHEWTEGESTIRAATAVDPLGLASTEGDGCRGSKLAIPTSDQISFSGRILQRTVSSSPNVR
jgi:YD repeat-containing protein